MEVTIQHETSQAPLVPEALAARVIADGYVVFESMRTRQRQVAAEVRAILQWEGIHSADSESSSPNSCMCIVDTDRWSLPDVLVWAAAADEREAGTL
jgi:hypothetical protein